MTPTFAPCAGSSAITPEPGAAARHDSGTGGIAHYATGARAPLPEPAAIGAAAPILPAATPATVICPARHRQPVRTVHAVRELQRERVRTRRQRDRRFGLALPEVDVRVVGGDDLAERARLAVDDQVVVAGARHHRAGRRDGHAFDDHLDRDRARDGRAGRRLDEEHARAFGWSLHRCRRGGRGGGRRRGRRRRGLRRTGHQEEAHDPHRTLHVHLSAHRA
jgi:hypothetical protein